MIVRVRRDSRGISLHRLTLDAASNKLEKIKSSKKPKEKERDEAEEEYERALSR